MGKSVSVGQPIPLYSLFCHLILAVGAELTRLR